ncbi:hypothetical protein Afil01_38440 [Actinorhabdospora filicis]|uniref:Uncharacterized protein n=1 Tax=Actinorhabdospora filicis TaxID=1785913 RepID=A0A9W6SNJ7_9ACTN|nr:hypothetical protein Afil01_38440 [Actinorhabdospora filicis]
MTSEGLRGCTHGMSISRVPARIERVPRVVRVLGMVWDAVMGALIGALTGPVGTAGLSAAATASGRTRPHSLQ